MARRAASTTKLRSSARVKHAKAQRRNVHALEGAAIATVVLAALGMLEPYVWLGALVRELALHLSLLALVVAGVAGVQRKWLPLAGAFLAAIALLVPMWPLVRAVRPTPLAGPTLRVAHAHLAGSNVSAATVASWLGSRTLHVGALTGLTEEAANGLGRKLAGYRVRTQRDPVTSTYSALLVQDKLPVVTRRDAPDDVLTGAFRLELCDLRVVVVDLPPLTSFSTLTARRARIAALARAPEVARSVWLGHLGGRAEASDLAPVLRDQELRDSRRGHGRLASMPAALGPLGLVRDHVLVHGWIGVRERTAEAAIVPGAHRTTSALLELTEPRCRAAN